MAYKTFIFGVDDIFNELQPYYAQAIQRGILEIIAYAVFENGRINLVTSDGKRGGADSLRDLQLTIISSGKDFYNRMKFLEAQGIPRNRIIDGRVFQVPNLDFNRLLAEGVAYGTFDKKSLAKIPPVTYPKIYSNRNTTVKLGTKSYINNSTVDGNGMMVVGNFSAVSWDVIFELGLNGEHRVQNVSSFPSDFFCWVPPDGFISPQGTCKIFIGNDVWIGRGCILKCTNPNKPLSIGDGAVIASDSVVVKSVPPYAIVGGNPAQIIKYRFEPHVIEALLRIKWWDWDIDKIHDNFRYFNDVQKFISLHDA